MKLIVNGINLLEDAKYVAEVYKSGFKPYEKFEGWEKVVERTNHKRGRKSVGFDFYPEKGIYRLHSPYNKI